MTNKDIEQRWLREFNDFVECDSNLVPENLSRTILKAVYKDLNPSSGKVFSKLVLVQAIGGTLSLAVCDQFGINPFHTDFSLVKFFMKFGHSACMFLCGFLFIAVGVSAGRWLLRREEFGVIRKNLFLQIFSLSLLFLGIFAMVGAKLTFAIGLFWIMGAILGGLASVFVPWHRDIPHSS